MHLDAPDCRYRVTWRMINIIDNGCNNDFDENDDNDDDDQMKDSDIV